MKKVFLLALLTAGVFTARAQKINGHLLSNIDVSYLRIMGPDKAVNSKESVQIDFGRNVKQLDPTLPMYFKDADDKNVILNSKMDALNFFSKYGYEFVATNGDSYILKNTRKRKI